MTTNSNCAAYNAAMENARLLGGNFKLVRERKRHLARDLVAASVVEGFALADAITDAKGKLRWTKLVRDEQNQMNVLFAAVRVIDGAWKVLGPDVQKAFLAGEKIFSTLAKEIKAAEKAKLEAQAEAEDAAKLAEQVRNTPVRREPEPLPEPNTDPIVVAMYQVRDWLQRHATAESMSEAETLALWDMTQELKAFEERVQKVAEAA